MLSKRWMILLAAAALVQGCASVKQGSIPVVDAGAPVSEEAGGRPAYRAGAVATSPAQGVPADSGDAGVVVMVPQQNSAPLQTFPAPDQVFQSGSAPVVSDPAPWTPQPPSQPVQQPSIPTGIPSGNTLSADERLDGPVLALLTTAQQQQGGGDFDGAASSLERAQRIAPREPQVLYRLAEVRLAQGDAVQAEQLARRGLSYAGDRPALQASLWELIAQARERQGNAAGAAQARERARSVM